MDASDATTSDSERIAELEQLVNKQRETIQLLRKERQERQDDSDTFIQSQETEDDQEDEDHHSFDFYDDDDLKRSFDNNPYELSNDVYSMLFLADWCSQPFCFALGIFVLKVLLFSFIAIDLFNGETSFLDASTLVRTAQCFMLPVAVAMQEDLIQAYSAIANIKYDPVILETCSGATKQKFHLALTLRFIDGMYSLSVNTILLLQSTEVLSLFLNFAALQFLQSIDDVAFDLASEGFLTDAIEDSVQSVKTVTLPQKTNKIMTKLDTCLFLGTYVILLALWIAVTVQGNQQ